MNWDMLGANPSDLRTNYVLAYLSVGAGRNVGAQFAAAGATGASESTIDAILQARALLYTPRCRATNAAWTAYRAGHYDQVRAMLTACAGDAGVMVTASACR
jgi:hypothetical protein